MSDSFLNIDRVEAQAEDQMRAFKNIDMHLEGNAPGHSRANDSQFIALVQAWEMGFPGPDGIPTAQPYPRTMIQRADGELWFCSPWVAFTARAMNKDTFNQYVRIYGHPRIGGQ